MPRIVATALFTIGIIGLFLLDRPVRKRTSIGLWVAFAWLFFILSRSPAAWLQYGPAVAYDGNYNLGTNPFNLVVYSLIILCGLIVLAARWNRVGECLRANWPILLFYVYCGISCTWSDYTSAVFRKWIRCLGDPIAVLIILTEIEPAAALNRLYARLGFVLLPLSVLWIKFYPELGRTFSNSWEHMYQGVAIHKNGLGAVCLVLGLGFLWRLLDHSQNRADPRRRRYMLADIAMLATTLWLFWRANSVTSSVCFAIGVVVILACSIVTKRRNRWALYLIFVTLVSVPIVGTYFAREIVVLLGRDPTLTGRTELWQQCLALAGNPMFGTGFESFWLGWRIQRIWDANVGIRLNEAHNGYLEVYLQLGWCGVGLLAAGIARGFARTVRSLGPDFTLGGLMMAYVITALSYNHSEAGFTLQFGVWVFLLLANMSVPGGAIPNRTRLDENRTESEPVIFQPARGFWLS